LASVAGFKRKIHGFSKGNYRACQLGFERFAGNAHKVINWRDL
jgi:hypothetical protein